MELTEADVALLNEIDTQAKLMKHLVDKLEARARTQGSVDGRAVSIARTNLQTGFMWLTSSIVGTGGAF